MRNELIRALKRQAERLLMVIPGTYESIAIEALYKEVRELYNFDCRTRSASWRSRPAIELSLHWMETCAWVLTLDPSLEDPDPASYGILRVSNSGGIKTIVCHCVDYEHFKTFPPVVKYQGERYARVGWNRDDNYCWYRANMALASGIA